MSKEKKSIVHTQPMYGKSKTKDGRRVKAGTRVVDSDGAVTVLLTPSGKGAKAAKELKENVRYTNTGEVKTNKNGKPQKLTKAQRAWRSGYLAAQKDSANCHNANIKGGGAK